MGNRKIVFITSGHSPFSSRLFTLELLSLKKHYDSLTIIAPYHKRKVDVDGICIIGIKKYKSRYNRCSTLFSLYKHASALNPSIVHCHEPDSLLVAYLLKKRFPRMKVIYDCHEFHPQSFTEKFFFPIDIITRLLIKKFENFLASKIDAVITVNEKLVDRFRRKNKFVVLLPNYPHLDIGYGKKRTRDFLSDNKLRLIYAGSKLSDNRGLFRMLDLMKHLRCTLQVRLVLIGKFASSKVEDKFWETAQRRGLSNKVDFKGYLPHKETISHMMNADIGLFLIHGNKRYDWGEPIKYFEYCACGLPVIISDLPAKRKLIEVNQNGILVSSNNAKEAADAVELLIKYRHKLEEMADRGRKAFVNKYNWELIENRLVEIYDMLLGKKSINKNGP